MTGSASRPRGTGLPDSLADALGEVATRQAFQRNTLLGAQGTPCTRLLILGRGNVLLSRRTPDDRESALYLLGPGDLLGEGSLRREQVWLVSARALTDGFCHSLPASHLPRLAQFYPELVAQIVSLLAERLEWAHRRAELMIYAGARDRLLGLLEALGTKHGSMEGGRLWVPLRVTQQQLGEMVGLARETVARGLAELEQQGVIERCARRGLWLRTER